MAQNVSAGDNPKPSEIRLREVEAQPLDKENCQAMTERIRRQFKVFITAQPENSFIKTQFSYLANPADGHDNIAPRNAFREGAGINSEYNLEGISCHIAFRTGGNFIENDLENALIKSEGENAQEIASADGCCLQGGVSVYASPQRVCQIVYNGICLKEKQVRIDSGSDDDHCETAQWNYSIDCFKTPSAFRIPSDQTKIPYHTYER